MNEASAQFINVDGLKTAYVCAGEGDDQVVLMLHGWGASIQLMQPLAAQLVKYNFRVYALDLPSFGQTSEPPAPWTVHDYANFVLNWADALQLDTFYLFGHSFGGRLGLVLGAEHSHRIQKMVLADSAGIRSKSPIVLHWRQSLYKFIRNSLRTLGVGQVANRLQSWYTNQYGSEDYKQASDVMRQTFINVVNHDLTETATKVQCPTLLLWGDQDQDTPLWQGQLLEELIPDAGLVVYEGAGHYSYLDRLYDAAHVIQFFFKQ